MNVNVPLGEIMIFIRELNGGSRAMEFILHKPDTISISFDRPCHGVPGAIKKSMHSSSCDHAQTFQEGHPGPGY